LLNFEDLLSIRDYIYYSYYDEKSEGIVGSGNCTPSREYDTILTTRIQSNLYYHIKDTKRGKGLIADNSKIKKAKTILVVDDDQNTTLAVKSGLENEDNHTTNRISYLVHTYNFPALALSEFKPNFYDLLLIDVEMPSMNGFELSSKIIEIDVDPKICFMSTAEVNYEALREIYPSVNFGCFIKKPISLEHLIRRVMAELE
jgi:CheY-like chemotaxis protein